MELTSVTSSVKRALWRVPQVQTLVHRARARRTVSRIDFSNAEALPILVYPMANVGSGTVVNTLDAIGLDRPILHLHFMMPAKLEQARLEHVAGPNGIPMDWCLANELGPRLRALEPGLQIPVVTLVRDPIARLVSGAFRMPCLEKGALTRDERPDANAALAHLEQVAQRDDTWRGPDQWFDNELKEMFGIDVFALPFVKDRGYGIYRSSRARVLLLCMEDLDDILGPALAEFLELPEPPKVIRANEPGSGDGDAHAQLEDRFRLPRDHVEKIYAERLPRHFYDAATLRRFAERWSR